MNIITLSLLLPLSIVAVACATGDTGPRSASSSSSGAELPPTASPGCGYDQAFNLGITHARAQLKMDSLSAQAPCRTEDTRAEVRRGYREGYILGLNGSTMGNTGNGVGVPRGLRSHAVAYEPWYHNELGWSLAGAAVALGIGAGFAEMSFQSDFDRVQCSDMAACPSMNERLELAADASTARETRNVLIGLSATTLLASVLTFALWKRPLDAGVEVADGVNLLIAPSFSPTTATLTGGLTF